MHLLRCFAITVALAALMASASAEAQSREPAQILPPIEVSPDDGLDDLAAHGRLMKTLPCMGCDALAAKAQPSAIVKTVLWMLYPAEPPQYSEAQLVANEVLSETHHTDQLP